MEENLIQKCIKKSPEYAVLILDSFQYEPIYTFPRSFLPSFKPPFRVLSSQIIDYKDSKCGIEIINSFYVLILLIPSIPDHIITFTLQEILTIIRPLLSEMSVLQEELSTPKSTDRSLKQKKILKPDLYEKLGRVLEVFLSLSIYKIFPYFLYEDEEFSSSSINYPSLCLPIGIGGQALFLPLSASLLFNIDLAFDVLFHESTVTVHEILNLNSPSGIIKNLAFIYKGYVVTSTLEAWELAETMRIYNLNRFYMRNDSFANEKVFEKVSNDGKEAVISLICVRGLCLVITIFPFTDGSFDYDPWMTDKGNRLLSEMQEMKIIDMIEEEYQKNTFVIEKQASEEAKKQELLDLMKKSRSLDSSPIGSPRGSANVCKTVNPAFFSDHNLYLFHYALIDLNTGLVQTPQILASSKWFLYVLRPLFSHYSYLYKKINEGSGQFFEVNAKFSDILTNEKIAAVKYKNCVLYAMFRGTKSSLIQFAFEQISLNFNFS